jgi:hypothetical protein
MEVKKIVMSPGFARSGTTYVFHQLQRKSPKYFNLPITKEVNLFNKKDPLAALTEAYRTHHADLFYIDYSPGYSTSRTEWVERFIEFPAACKKVIIHLRHPVSQIYAHYLQNLKAQIAKRKRGDNVHYSLFSSVALQKYLSLRTDAFCRIVDHVGRENIFIINFHKDLSNAASLSSRLSHFLDVELASFDDERISPGGWLPYYVYGGEQGTEIAVGQFIAFVPPQALLLVNGRESMLWKDVTEDQASMLINNSSSWTRAVDESQFEELYRVVQKDWEALLDLFSLDAKDYSVDRSLTAKPADIDETFLTKSGLKYEPLESVLKTAKSSV